MAEVNPFAQLFMQPDNNTVQLAVLQPGAQDAQIEIQLTDAQLSSIRYRCISYDRTQNYDTTEILVDGKATAVPGPLEAALRALRREHRPWTLWADLLVGSSVEERSAQAAAMKAIMEGAADLVAWLGPGDDHSAAAFEILKTLAIRWQQAVLHSDFPRNVARATMKQMVDLQTHMLSKSVDDLQPENKPLWEAIGKIFSSSYFRSIQTIPDMLLARKATVTLGNSSIPWPDFVSAARAAPLVMGQQMKMTVTQPQLDGFELIMGIDLADQKKSAGQSLELLPMIQSARDCSTSDPRELVYSMLPIITQSKRATDAGRTETPPKADYSKTTAQVFTEAARYIVHERQDLLLWWAEGPPRRRKVKDLPSWVPDWTTPLPKLAVKVLPDVSNGMRVWWEHLSTPAKRISVDEENALHVQAHALDRVIRVSEIFTQENCRRLCLTEFQKVNHKVPGESNDAKMQKVFRTLILNQAGMGATIRDNAAPPHEMWQSFSSLMAEERILELLGCTFEQLTTEPEWMERVKNAEPNSAIAVMAPLAGGSQEFEQWLRRNAIGRRFFQTAGGRIGMTAIEALAEGQSDSDGTSTSDQPPVANFDEALADPVGGMMLQAFQAYVARQHPEAAGLLANAISGDMPGQLAPGVRSGDLVVALVGGFQPYILRPLPDLNAALGAEHPSLDTTSRYRYVGDCYLHGVMEGEVFKNRGWFGSSWTREVKLVDITIV